MVKLIRCPRHRQSSGAGADCLLLRQNELNVKSYFKAFRHESGRSGWAKLCIGTMNLGGTPGRLKPGLQTLGPFAGNVLNRTREKSAVFGRRFAPRSQDQQAFGALD